jgi:hypothetical protein
MPLVPLDKTFPARSSGRGADFEFEFARPSRRATAREILDPQLQPKKAPRPPRAPRPKLTGSKRKPRRGTVSPLGVTGRPSSQAPRGRVRARKEIPGPTPPDVSVDLTKLSPSASAESERKQAISSALLKGAAFVQPSSVSGTLQGLLSGLGIGMEIDTAMQRYRDRKRTDAESTRAEKRAPGAIARPPMRSNYGRSPDYRHSLPGVV